MAWGLPKLPGLQFADPTKTQFQRNSSIKFYQGHRWYTDKVKGPGGSATDVESNAFAMAEDSVIYDPSLTYGRVKQAALPQVIPHWVHYDKKCLKFIAFMKQPVYDNPDEKYRLRIVNLIYFLEDDTMTIAEPITNNSGIWQGKMVKRGRIPKNNLGEFWHWKDLDNGKDICIYGKVFHTVSCDLFTKEWLESQGIELSKEEDLPIDQYTKKEMWKNVPIPRRKTRTKEDKLRRFLEYNDKTLAFDVVWDDRDSPYGELVELKLLYFLEDDRISIKEVHDGRGGKDPFPLLLKKTKLPKKWKDKPVNFPSGVLEVTDEEVTEYYAPRDLIVGQTVFVYGRRILIYDCDPFTRNYYRSMLNIEQPPRVEIKRETQKKFERELPPHFGIGSPEDALQSCFGLEPKKPWKDVVKYNLNAAKNLRYLCELVPIHPEDEGRRFILQYNLGNGYVKIDEIKRRNSGIREGAFLKAMKLELPDSDHSFPTYYTPVKFYIGAEIPVFKHRFKIIGCDLYVYRYMTANPEKFPQEVIENVRNYHMREGNLKDELAEGIAADAAAAKRAQLQAIGQKAVAEPSAMERCLADLKVVEGSAEPPRPPTPPRTTDLISYDDSLRATRDSKLTCDNVQPLKGILKAAGASARDDQQKVVCFTGPAVDERKPDEEYSLDREPRFNEDPDYCLQYKTPGWQERAERRAQGECPYEIIPNERQMAAAAMSEQDKDKMNSYLGSYGVDCKEIPDYMRLAPDAYEKVKKLRKETHDISPAAQRVAEYPRLPPPAVDSCVNPPPEDTGPCAPRKEEDVSFACPHVEPRSPCCDPYSRPKESERTHL